MFVTPVDGGTAYEVDIDVQYREGIDKLNENEFEIALEKWESTALMSNADRDNADLECRVKIDFARTYIPRSTNVPYQPFISQEGNNTLAVSPFGLAISPNPTDGKVTVGTRGGVYSAHFFNTFGKLVHTIDFVDNVRIDLSELIVGMYFVQVSNAETTNIEVLRLIVE